MLLKFGIISEVDASKGLARVKFDGNDGMVSYWLPMAMPGTVDAKFSIPYNINEHVYCIMDKHMEHGVIAGAIYDANNSPDGGDNKKVRLSFVQGLSIEYDRNSKTLSISGAGDLNLDINGTGKGKVNIKCNSAVIESLTGDVELKSITDIKLTSPSVICSGVLSAAAIATAPGAGGDGGINITGDVTVSGKVEAAQVKDGTVELGTHVHGGVQTGSGTSGVPVP